MLETDEELGDIEDTNPEIGVLGKQLRKEMQPTDD